MQPAWSGGLCSVLFALALCSALTPPLEAQLLTRGDLSGVVRSSELPVADASVTLSPASGGFVREQFPPRDGRFSFRALPPGSYEVRVEAVGYRPRVVTGVEVAPGRTITLSVDLTPEPPPVTQVDTVRMVASGDDGSAPGVVDWIPARSADRLPDRDRQTAGLGRLVPSRIGSGSEGLPGRGSLVALDGVLLRPAIGTGAGGDPDGAFPFPRNALGGVAVLGVGEDQEWGLAPGGILALFPALGGGGAGAELWGSGSGGPLWSSGQFPGTVPSTSSFWGGGRAGFSLDGERGKALVAAEARRVQAPRPPALPEAGMQALSSRSDLPGAASLLAGPGVDQTTAVSAMTRVDWAGEGGQGGGVTVAFGRSETTGDPTGSVYLPAGERTPGVRADLAASAGYLYPVGERVRLEARAGLHRTERDHSAVPAAASAGALLVQEGGALGASPEFPLRVQRSTASGTAMVHFWDGNQYAKGGFEGRFSSHERDGLPGQRGEFAFDGLEGLAQGRGASTVVLPGPGVNTFDVLSYGMFARVGWTPSPGLELTAGIRRDVEYLPASEIAADTVWGRLTRLASILPSSVGTFSGSAGLSWDPAADGSTVLRVSGGMHHGEMDPGMLADLIQMDGRARVRRTFGAVSGWPAAPAGSSGVEGALLALPGPDITPPRSLRGSAGFQRRLAEGTTLQLHGVVRRTENLVRAADLNRIPLPRALASGVRPVFGIPAKEGAVVGAVPGSNRLFPGYDRVWALNTDGWSEYVGVGGGLDHTGEGWGLRASYLFSRTEDNIPGFVSGNPLAALDPFPEREVVDWREGRSDMDLPHRASVEGRVLVPGRAGIELSAVYTLRSGLPFTAGFRPGVDANGDGSWLNDPAVLTGAPDVASLLARWGCEQPVADGIVPRNGCRGPAVHGLDLRLVLGGLAVGSASVAFTVEALGVLESDEGVRDTALFLVDPSTDQNLSGGLLTVPLVANPGFGEVLRASIPGRLLRLGVRFTP